MDIASGRRFVPVWLVFAALLSVCGPVHAWWDEAWSQRVRLAIDTGDSGVRIGSAVGPVPVAVRLHSGNFDFVAAREDGGDLRVLAGDDKTPLPFAIERFDPVNELALLWVLMPTVLPGTDANALYVYAGHPTAGPPPAGSGFDDATRMAVHFGDPAAPDHRARLRAGAAVPEERNALLAAGARLDGRAIVWAGNGALDVAPASPLTVSLWVRPQAAGEVVRLGPLALVLVDGAVEARVGGTVLRGGGWRPDGWTHLALVLDGREARLHVDGEAVARAAVDTPAIGGAELRLGEGLRGVADELQLHDLARSDDWLRLAVATQGSDGRALRSTPESRDAEGGASHGYLGVLVANLTTDAWVVIVALALMFAVAAWVMVAKAMLVSRVDRANRDFLERFRGTDDLLRVDAAGTGDSTLMRLYRAGVRELDKRRVGQPGAPPLSGASLDAVKAAVDADMVRESHRLNAQMVLLTIAISGGPFLGLLGTVVGVMITFAAIAAAGDVNVNAIAPGIAAALLATVAGLAVAIPSLFGYNWLASRIKTISADMQIFVDEFVTRVAERYGAQ